MRRAPWALALALGGCFSETDAGSGSGPDDSGSSSATTLASTTTAATTDATTTASTAETIGEVTTDTPTTTVDPDSSTGADACAEGVLVPPFMAPWTGPFVLATGEPMAPPPMCPDGAPAGPPLVSVDAPGTCICTCAEPLHEHCALTIEQGTAAGCRGPSVAIDGACTPLDDASTHARALIGPGTCTPVTLPEPAPGEGAHVLCDAMPRENGCVVVPQGLQGPCISTDTPTMCPAEYPVAVPSKHVACGVCGLCPSLTTHCRAQVQLTAYSSMGCDGSTFALLPDACASDPVARFGIGSVGVVETARYSCGAVAAEESPVSICCAT